MMRKMLITLATTVVLAGSAAATDAQIIEAAAVAHVYATTCDKTAFSPSTRRALNLIFDSNGPEVQAARQKLLGDIIAADDARGGKGYAMLAWCEGMKSAAAKLDEKGSVLLP